jgi:hypothetical protein
LKIIEIYDSILKIDNYTFEKWKESQREYPSVKEVCSQN